jgi:hypothetical protein
MFTFFYLLTHYFTARGSLLLSSPQNVARYGLLWPIINATIFYAPSLVLAVFLSFVNWRELVDSSSNTAITLTAAYVLLGSGVLVLIYGKNFFFFS